MVEPVPEDPVTESIHVTLVPYGSRKLQRNSLLAFQAWARGCWLHCKLTVDREVSSGNTVTFMEAKILLPDLS